MAAVSDVSQVPNAGSPSQGSSFLKAVLNLREDERLVPVMHGNQETFVAEKTSGCMRQVIAFFRRWFLRPFGRDSIYNRMVECLNNPSSMLDSDLQINQVGRIQDYARAIGLADKANNFLLAELVMRLFELIGQAQLPSLDTACLGVTTDAKRKIPLDTVMPGTNKTFRNALVDAVQSALTSQMKNALDPIVQKLQELNSLALQKLEALTSYSPIFLDHLKKRCLDKPAVALGDTLYEKLVRLVTQQDNQRLLDEINQTLQNEYLDYLRSAVAAELARPLKIEDIHSLPGDEQMRHLVSDDLSEMISKCRKYFGEKVVHALLTLDKLQEMMNYPEKKKEFVRELQAQQQLKIDRIDQELAQCIPRSISLRFHSREMQVQLCDNLSHDTAYTTPLQFIKGCVKSGFFHPDMLLQVIKGEIFKCWVRAFLRDDPEEQALRERCITELMQLREGRELLETKNELWANLVARLEKGPNPINDEIERTITSRIAEIRRLRPEQRERPMCRLIWFMIQKLNPKDGIQFELFAQLVQQVMDSLLNSSFEGALMAFRRNIFKLDERPPATAAAPGAAAENVAPAVVAAAVPADTDAGVAASAAAAAAALTGDRTTVVDSGEGDAAPVTVAPRASDGAVTPADNDAGVGGTVLVGEKAVAAPAADNAAAVRRSFKKAGDWFADSPPNAVPPAKELGGFLGWLFGG